MKLSELFSRQRTIYLFAFPFGGFLLLSFGISQLLQGYKVEGVFSIFFGMLPVIYAVILYFQTEVVNWASSILFYPFAAYLCILTAMKINVQAGDPEVPGYFVTAALNGTGFWYIITYWLVYFVAGRRQGVVYMCTSIAMLFVTMLYHFVFMQGFKRDAVIDWAILFTGVLLMVFIVVRVGHYHRDLIEKDSLTGLYNRHELHRILTIEMVRAERYQNAFCVILFDVDHFKNINDTYGHTIGDKVLKGVANLISRRIRVTDSLGRWGGEEFLLLLPNTGLAESHRTAERLCEALRKERFEPLNKVTASFGVTAFQAGQTIEQLLHAADTAMYQAKQNGRNQVVSFTLPTSPTPHTETHD